MNRFIRTYRPPDLEAEIVEARKHALDIMAQQAPLRAMPAPDTFLGRAHHKILSLPQHDARG
jgi:hypothetical protein